MNFSKIREKDLNDTLSFKVPSFIHWDFKFFFLSIEFSRSANPQNILPWEVAAVTEPADAHVNQ